MSRSVNFSFRHSSSIIWVSTGRWTDYANVYAMSRFCELIIG